MTTYVVPDMDCGGCVASITSAVKRLDAKAVVDANLETKQVKVEGDLAPEAVRAAIEDAGFTVS